MFMYVFSIGLIVAANILYSHNGGIIISNNLLKKTKTERKTRATRRNCFGRSVILEESTMKEEKTLNHLMAAFAGEAQANRKYLAYAKKAEAEGKHNVAKLFRVTAEAETIHALKEFELAGKVGSTSENLQAAIDGETYEFKEMYPEFFSVAEEEGNKAAARAFKFALEAEEVHAKLFQEALDNLEETEEVFYYLCPVCGNIERSIPEKCFICQVPGEKFIKY